MFGHAKTVTAVDYGVEGNKKKYPRRGAVRDGVSQLSVE